MKRFIRIPTEILKLNLSPLQLLVYTGLISLKSKENYTVATAETISKRCNISKNSVYTAVAALKSLGLIRKRNNIKDGKNTANSYYIKYIDGNFIKVDYSIFKFNLSPAQFAAYIAIKSKCNHSNHAFPSLRQISELAHICIDTVISAVRALANKGLLLFKHYMRRCGCYGHNNYIIIDDSEVKEVSEPKRLKLKTTFAEVTYKKVASLFLHKLRYSKFWSTTLDSLKYVVRKKISNCLNILHIHKHRV